MAEIVEQGFFKWWSQIRNLLHVFSVELVTRGLFNSINLSCVIYRLLQWSEVYLVHTQKIATTNSSGKRNVTQESRKKRMNINQLGSVFLVNFHEKRSLM